MTSSEQSNRRRRRVAGVLLRPVTRFVYRSDDGLFEFMSESSPTRLGPKGWCVRALVGLQADPDGREEPLTLGNGLTWADALREAVVYAYRLKWEWLRDGTLTYEQVDAAQGSRS